MKKMAFCILVILLAVAFIAPPAFAAFYYPYSEQARRIPNIDYARSNAYSPGVKDMPTKIAYIPAFQAFNLKPISPSGFNGAGTGITISTGKWSSLFGT